MSRTIFKDKITKLFYILNLALVYLQGESEPQRQALEVMGSQNHLLLRNGQFNLPGIRTQNLRVGRKATLPTKPPGASCAL